MQRYHLIEGAFRTTSLVVLVEVKENSRILTTVEFLNWDHFYWFRLIVLGLQHSFSLFGIIFPNLIKKQTGIMCWIEHIYSFTLALLNSKWVMILAITVLWWLHVGSLTSYQLRVPWKLVILGLGSMLWAIIKTILIRIFTAFYSPGILTLLHVPNWGRLNGVRSIINNVFKIQIIPLRTIKGVFWSGLVSISYGLGEWIIFFPFLSSIRAALLDQIILIRISITACVDHEPRVLLFSLYDGLLKLLHFLLNRLIWFDYLIWLRYV